MFFLTLVAVVSLQTVGTILVIAMLITPAATAYLLTNHLLKMIITCTAFFILAFLFSPTKGILFQKGSR